MPVITNKVKKVSNEFIQRQTSMKLSDNQLLKKQNTKKSDLSSGNDFRKPSKDFIRQLNKSPGPSKNRGKDEMNNILEKLSTIKKIERNDGSVSPI